MTPGASQSSHHHFPFEPLDRTSWFGAGHPVAFAPGFELTWTKAPSDDDLAQAVLGVVCRYPVLGCRLLTGPWSGWWEGPRGGGVAPVLMPVESATVSPEEQNGVREAWLREPMDAVRGELWRIHRVNLTGGGQWWVILFNPVVADGTGWSSVLDTLFSYLPDPPFHPAPDLGPRNLNSLVEGIPLPSVAAQPTPRHLRSPWPRLSPLAGRHFLRQRFSSSVLPGLRARARQHGGTLADVLHALVVDACAKVGGFSCAGRTGDWIRLVVPLDGRRHARGPVGLGNLSGQIALHVACPPPSDLGDLVEALARQKQAVLAPGRFAQLARRLRWRSVLPVWASARLSSRLSQRPAALSALVMNLNDLERLFPHATGLLLSDIQPLVPAAPATPCTVVMSAFAGHLSLSVSLMEGCLPRGRLQAFADQITSQATTWAGLS